MPDPKDHLDEEYTYVRPYVRRKPTPQGGGDNEQIGCILMAAFAVGIIAIVCAVVWYIILQLARTWYYWLGPLLFVVIVAVFLLLRLKSRRRRIQKSDPEETTKTYTNLGLK